jgi:hypothetical protein
VTPTLPRSDRRRCAVLALLAGAAALPGWAQGTASAPSAGIYTCIDDHGRRLTADRPIPECLAKEQRVLNRDGSLREVHPPSLTSDERAEAEARQRQAAEARAAQADAVRRDRNLVGRFPNEEAHRRAREAALEPVRIAMRNSEQRLKELASERKPLLDEAEFYAARAMPARLRAALDANDAAVAAQRAAMVNHEAELARINRIYDLELERLRKLWAGAPPGSLPPIAGAATVGTDAASSR